MRREQGFTLVELLVAMVAALLVFGATLNLVVVGLHKQTAIQDRVTQVQTAQVAEARLIRELRQATAVTVNSTSSLTYTIPTTAGSSTVTYACTSGTCKRTIGSTSVTQITGVTNTDNFTLSTGYVTLKFTVSATGRPAIVVTDGVDLRNVTLGS